MAKAKPKITGGKSPTQKAPAVPPPPGATHAPPPVEAAPSDDGPKLEEGVKGSGGARVGSGTGTRTGTSTSPRGKAFSQHSTSGRPAPFASLPDAKVIHWRDLHPETASLMIDNETGEDKTPPTRSGGMFSVRRLALANQINPSAPLVHKLVPTSLRPQEWPIAKHQVVQENLEIQFDFREELVAYAEGYNARNVVELDPLKKNDLASGQFPPGFDPSK